ncbi:hypothetical protein NLX83_36595 [Allokutzneria sp. A3M-2-11 16]|uniref:hypothetical protein n=1 Tax=Allokutzneria sp. A3M-2-11 16 TaxID=2962043 RepID=UPI0020B8C043|nr:hypothetical protein [Allokutzneria sp. A3M-2-11 16]MCP3804800.1 hypothetical protein [Allokutzneria sp. A3M-2-11 16]
MLRSSVVVGALVLGSLVPQGIAEAAPECVRSGGFGGLVCVTVQPREGTGPRVLGEWRGAAPGCGRAELRVNGGEFAAREDICAHNGERLAEFLFTRVLPARTQYCVSFQIAKDAPARTTPACTRA